ncbi:MAG: hypothetical protein IJQ78_05795 [Selenomonadaceae bacterium]|nr:hypothetical protein [Selenomonadaceae bacterium]
MSARLGHGVARQGLGLARGLAHWRKGGACRTAAQPLPADAALVFQRGAPDLRGESKIKLSQISWWKMGDKPEFYRFLTFSSLPPLPGNCYNKTMRPVLVRSIVFHGREPS